MTNQNPTPEQITAYRELTDPARIFTAGQMALLAPLLPESLTNPEPDLDALVKELREVGDEAGYYDYVTVNKVADALVAERARADQADSTLEAVRRYAEDRSIHHRAKKDSVVGSWRIASDLLAILDRDAASSADPTA